MTVQVGSGLAPSRSLPAEKNAVHLFSEFGAFGSSCELYVCQFLSGLLIWRINRELKKWPHSHVPERAENGVTLHV